MVYKKTHYDLTVLFLFVTKLLESKLKQPQNVKEASQFMKYEV